MKCDVSTMQNTGTGSSNSSPTVSFVIPCYKLAHLLSECIQSILAQTYRDYEILIMDDCSPDRTAEVAQSFTDCRVKYFRNEVNLGHLRNYNRGIGLAKGRYVWLISADDRLRMPYALEHYVRTMEAHPNVGYACSAGVEIDEAGRETRVLDDYVRADKDTIFNGRGFIPEILGSTGILAASVMVRKQCYLAVETFPLDLPHQADIYLWCRFALEHDVAYFAEPMIHYRRHAASMLNTFMRERPEVIMADELNVLWRIKRESERLGYRRLARRCQRFLGDRYASYIAATKFRDRASPLRMTRQECIRSIGQSAHSRDECKSVQAEMHAYLGDQYRWHGNDDKHALRCYRYALACRLLMPQVWIKYAVLKSGSVGIAARSWLKAIRRRTTTAV